MAEGIVDVMSTTWNSEVLQAEGLVMVVFWAEWCEPCMKMAPTVEEMAKECPEKVKVVRLNIDDNADIASTYKVSIVPTVMFFKEGQKRREIITNVSRTQLEAAIELL
jgi:thioredoxin 1